jgi:hypothetical protein
MILSAIIIITMVELKRTTANFNVRENEKKLSNFPVLYGLSWGLR